MEHESSRLHDLDLTNDFALVDELDDLQLKGFVLGAKDDVEEVEAAKRKVGKGVPCGFGYIAPWKICRINEVIFKAYDEAINHKRGGSIQTGIRIPDGVAARYGRVFDADCSNAKINLNLSNIRHIEKEHGVHSEWRKGQAGISRDDLRWLPKIVGYPRKIIKGKRTSRGQRCLVVKGTPDKTFYAVLSYKTKWKALNVVTMWAVPK